MYNNIGLSTIKGKGTTGYIQNNRINFQTQRKRELVGSEYYSKKPRKENYKDESLREHELRRKIEVNIREFIEKQFQSLSSEEKKEKIKEKRKEINDLIEKKLNEEREKQNKDDNNQYDKRNRKERKQMNKRIQRNENQLLLDVLFHFSSFQFV